VNIIFVIILKSYRNVLHQVAKTVINKLISGLAMVVTVDLCICICWLCVCEQHSSYLKSLTLPAGVASHHFFENMQLTSGGLRLEEPPKVCDNLLRASSL